MLDKGIETLAKQLEFTVEKDCAYGVYFKYLISFYEDSGRTAFYINYLIDEQDDPDAVCLEIEDKIKEISSEYSVVKYTCDAGGMTVITDCEPSELLKLLDYCVELISGVGALGYDHCSYCGKEFGDNPIKKIQKGKLNFVACENCALTEIEEQCKNQNELPDPTKPQKIKAVIFAALGGFVGCLLYLAVYLFIIPLFSGNQNIDVTFIACFCGFITAALVYGGYVIFVKKDSLSAKLTVGAISLFFSAIGQYLGILCIIMRDLELNNLIGRVFLMPFRSTATGSNAVNYAGMFYIRLGISLLFALCGAFIFLVGLYERSHVATEQIKVDTIKIG